MGTVKRHFIVGSRKSQGLFTKELETALLIGEIDFVVHSLKDLPTCLPKGLTIAAISEREDPRDVVLFKRSLTSNNVTTLQDLAPGSVVGTSSTRRIAQLKHHYPHLSFMDVRGNLNTRLKKLDDQGGPYSALVLAAAGVKRMGWKDRIGQFLESEFCSHAVGQGALGIECKEDNFHTIKLLESLNHSSTYFRCIAERSFLRTLEGGCSVPVAVFSEVNIENKSPILTLRGSVWSLDGSKSVVGTLKKCLNSSLEENCLSDIDEDFNFTSVHPRVCNEFKNDSHCVAVRIGIKLGHTLLNEGAKLILEEVKSQSVH